MSEQPPSSEAKLSALEAAIGYRFKNRELLERSLVHSSAREDATVRDNQVLEFLGDAVLGMAVSDLSSDAAPERDEGDLTRLRASLVNSASLAGIARELGLGDWLKLGKGEERSGGRDKERILAACYEAVLGAVFRDSDYPTARAMIATHFGNALVTGTAPWDFKTTLQELTQKEGRGTPTYRLVRQSGPAHDRRFDVEVVLATDSLGSGSGASRKEAEQDAARAALANLESIPQASPGGSKR